MTNNLRSQLIQAAKERSGNSGCSAASEHGNNQNSLCDSIAAAQPKTLPEMLDAAETGEDFGVVLAGLFKALENDLGDAND